MRLLKWILAGIVAGIAIGAFRDSERGAWLSPALPGARLPADEEEPVLGYDGMDQETLLDWIGEADLEPDVIERMMRYEEANRQREPVLEALAELLY